MILATCAIIRTISDDYQSVDGGSPQQAESRILQQASRARRQTAFRAYLGRLRRIKWVVYAKEPFAGPRQVLRYLSRYTHRVAISNRRLISADERGVIFKYKDYRLDGSARYKTMTLATDEFIRRFLIHVLPKGVASHPPLQAARQSQPCRQHRTSARVACYPIPLTRAQTIRAHHNRRPTHAAISMSMLRWPHDHHRDLRARMRTKAPRVHNE